MVTFLEIKMDYYFNNIMKLKLDELKENQAPVRILNNCVVWQDTFCKGDEI